MSGRPWYAHFPADYERKTSHLTMLEDGAYRRLLDHYYATGKPIPANAVQLYRICRAFDDAERSAIDSALVQFFTKERDGYHNKRADEELAKAAELGETRRKAALSRYAIAPAIAPAIAGHLHTPSPSPSPTQKEEVSISPKVGSERVSRKPLNGHQNDFDAFWATYPRRVAKGDAVKAYAQAIKKIDPGAILAGASRYAGIRNGEDAKYTAYPGTWLRAECWADDFTIPGSKPGIDPDMAAALEAERQHRLKHGEIE